ncbi:unnamed protein product [Dovyalis caffra]|uniref:Uncharacterized protein n=1 Tax=Dovyalis caffra TaxID=77055 RepID=A0AAV1RT78_9ROSI|nr:unnamed protein product [Dovyalis caffra]
METLSSVRCGLGYLSSERWIKRRSSSEWSKIENKEGGQAVSETRLARLYKVLGVGGRKDSEVKQ